MSVSTPMLERARDVEAGVAAVVTGCPGAAQAACVVNMQPIAATSYVGSVLILFARTDPAPQRQIKPDALTGDEPFVTPPSRR